MLRLKYWSKIVRLDNSRLIKQVYIARREEFNRKGKKDTKNWCFWTWKFLKELGLEHIWESENFGSRNDWEVVIRATIKEKEEKFWLARLQEKPKLRLYRQIKTKLRMEDYLNEMNRDKHRQLTMLRGGTNHLRIERGRWVGEKVNERVCMVCLCDDIENEQHFLLECPMYVCERARLFEEIRQKCKIDIESLKNYQLMNLLIGEGIGGGELGREVRKLVLFYISKANKIRNRFVSS